MKPVAHVITHPLLSQCLTVLRDKKSGMVAFRKASSIASQILFFEATKSLSMRAVSVSTPLAKTKAFQVRDELVMVPILRAGLAMLSAVEDLVPEAPVGFVGLRRDEKTAVAQRYYENIPDKLLKREIIVLDPMLATGGTLDETVTLLERRGARKIRCVSIVAAPEGITRMNQRHPKVELFTAAIDRKLNAKKFIVPGLGDFGDRYFGTEA